MPVTFISRIKSSGYGQESGLGSGSGSGRGTTRMRSLSVPRGTGRGTMGGQRIVAYPVPEDAVPMNVVQAQYRIPTAPPVLAIAYSPDAKYLATVVGGAEYRSLPCLRLPITKYAGEGLVLQGHATRLSSVGFSTDSSLVVAGGEREAHVWRLSRPDGCALTIDSWRPTPAASTAVVGVGVNRRPASANATKVEKSQLFPANISSAQFFFMDKFIILCMRSYVLMYNFAPGGMAQDDLSQRGPSAGCRYRQAHLWDCGSSVTALVSMNSVQSPLLVASTADKRILMLDAATGAVCREVRSQHSRPVHSLALACPSPHTAVSAAACQIFASVAADGVVALWDVRSPSCSWRYTGHRNRSEPIGVALSPCLRLLSVGSEDGCPRTIDLRMGRELFKHPAQRDVVSALQYNPLTPQLACGSYDGEVLCYSTQ